MITNVSLLQRNRKLCITIGEKYETDQWGYCHQVNCIELVSKTAMVVTGQKIMVDGVVEW